MKKSKQAISNFKEYGYLETKEVQALIDEIEELTGQLQRKERDIEALMRNVKMLSDRLIE